MWVQETRNWMGMLSFSALTLLAGHQEEHSVCKK